MSAISNHMALARRTLAAADFDLNARGKMLLRLVVSSLPGWRVALFERVARLDVLK